MPIYATPDIGGKAGDAADGGDASPGGSRNARRLRSALRSQPEDPAPSARIFQQRGAAAAGGGAFGGRAPRPPPPRPPHLPASNPLQHSGIKVMQKKGGMSKQHQMEDDGLLIHLYKQLSLKKWSAKKEYQGCPDARCPETVVYEHNFPRAWYYYDSKNKEIQKRHGSFLDRDKILFHFSQPPPGTKDFDEKNDIVAQYLCSENVPSEDPDKDEEIQTSVEFFTAATLKEWLQRDKVDDKVDGKNRPDGVLQRFVVPKGRNPHNFQIQAVWSPRVTALYKRTNRHRLRDHTVGIYERAVTADGPPHYTREDYVSTETKKQILKICKNFCTHFEGTEKKPVARVVLYFKLDENDKVWILWASSLRIGQSRHSTTQHAPQPLNLSTRFETPDKAVQERRRAVQGPELELKLLTKDVEQYKLSGDLIFAHTHCAELPSQCPAPRRNRGLIRPLSSRDSYAGGSPDQRRIASRAEPPLIEDRPPDAAAHDALRRARPRTAGTGATSGSSPLRSSRRSPRGRRDWEMEASERAPFLPSPRYLLTRVPPPSSPCNPFHHQAVRLGLEGCERRPARGAADDAKEGSKEGRGGGGGGRGGGGGGDEGARGADAAQWDGDGWWRGDPEVEMKWRKLEADMQLVLAWIEEQVYHIYSHTLNHGTRELYVCSPPEEVWQVLCCGDGGESRDADRLMEKIGMFPYDDEDAGTASPDGGTREYYFAGSGCASRLRSDGVNHKAFFLQQCEDDLPRPISSLSNSAEPDIRKMFDGRRAELRDWAKANCRTAAMDDPSAAGQ